MFDLVYGRTLQLVCSEIETFRASLAPESADVPCQNEVLLFVFQILTSLLRSLEYIHSRGVAHLDLKPSNVMVSVDARGGLSARLIDFGCARLTGAVGFITLLSGHASKMACTATYVAPEVALAAQLRASGHHRQSAGSNIRLTVQADMYSFGLLAFEMLTGQPAARIRLTPIPLLPAMLAGVCSPELTALLVACIDTHLLPEQRPTAAQLRQAMEQVTGNGDLVASACGLKILGTRDDVVCTSVFLFFFGWPLTSSESQTKWVMRNQMAVSSQRLRLRSPSSERLSGR